MAGFLSNLYARFTGADNQQPEAGTKTEAQLLADLKQDGVDADLIQYVPGGAATVAMVHDLHFNEGVHGNDVIGAASSASRESIQEVVGLAEGSAAEALAGFSEAAMNARQLSNAATEAGGMREAIAESIRAGDTHGLAERIENGGAYAAVAAELEAQSGHTKELAGLRTDVLQAALEVREELNPSQLNELATRLEVAGYAHASLEVQALSAAAGELSASQISMVELRGAAAESFQNNVEAIGQTLQEAASFSLMAIGAQVAHDADESSKVDLGACATGGPGLPECETPGLTHAEGLLQDVQGQLQAAETDAMSVGRGEIDSASSLATAETAGALLEAARHEGAEAGGELTMD